MSKPSLDAPPKRGAKKPVSEEQFAELVEKYYNDKASYEATMKELTADNAANSESDAPWPRRKYSELRKLNAGMGFPPEDLDIILGPKRREGDVRGSGAANEPNTGKNIIKVTSPDQLPLLTSTSPEMEKYFEELMRKSDERSREMFPDAWAAMHADQSSDLPVRQNN